MELFDQSLLHKYLHNQCTPEEYERVLEWFTTLEGRVYLDTVMTQDLDQATPEMMMSPSKAEDLHSAFWPLLAMNKLRQHCASPVYRS